MSDAIINKLIDLKYISKNMSNIRDYSHLDILTEEKVNQFSLEIANKRSYPTSLAKRCEASL